MPIKVLLTGGAGYLGSIMVEHFLNAGHHVTVVDNLIYGQQSLFQFAANKRFDFLRGDARDEAFMRDPVRAADVLVPLAAVVGAPACLRDPIAARTTNLDAVLMLDRMRSRSQLLIYPNTNSGYGAQTGELFCTEETPLEPISLYGQTKTQAETALLQSPNVITLRLATVFGTSARMRLDLLVNHFVHAAVTDGYLIIFEKDFKRNYIHIRDVADCFVFCMENARAMVGQPYNAGLDKANLSKEQLAEKIRQYVPGFYVHHAAVGSDPDKRNYIVSNRRLREAGFEARRSLDEGIQELIKAYRMIGRSELKNV
jgi:nucleoside-diphosphate-sugar epimerase